MHFTLDDSGYGDLLNNPNISENIIDTLLSIRPDSWILTAIAGSKMATAAQLEALYKKSKSYKVLHNLVNNPKTPNNILADAPQ